jgi:hypothetical protein
MAKSSGLGDFLFVDGVDLSGDVGVVDTLACPAAVQDVTGLSKFAFERLLLKRDGVIKFTPFWNNAVGVGAEHGVLSTLPRGDRLVSYLHGAAIGNPAANLLGKQVDFDWKRGAAGDLLGNVDAQGNGFGLEWANQLTAGFRTDVAATNGTAWNAGASTSFGWQAYLHVNAFTGTDVTIKLQDSADNVTFADVASGAFAQITSLPSPLGSRLAIGGVATLRQYVRASTVTTGGFTSVKFAVNVVKNTQAVSF